MREDDTSQTSRLFLAHATEELARGELLQASEKLWGAAAHAVKAVAQRRGWAHNSHRSLVEAVDRLVAETGQADLDTLFKVAQALHANFYEGWMTQDSIQRAVGEMEEFVSRVEQL